MTPRVLKDAKIKGGYKFFFYSNEGEDLSREEPHIHVRQAKRQAKFWLEPEVKLARTKGFRDHELREILRILEEYRDQIMDDWNQFFGV
jgi:hypothetical protein